MKHASKATLVELETLLGKLRLVPGLVERASGTFYLKSRAYLHFHEDPAGLFADVRLDRVNFERIAVTTADQRRTLLARVVANLGAE